MNDSQQAPVRMGSGLRVERRGSGVVIVSIDLPGETVNTLRESFADDFLAVLDSLDTDATARAVVLTSGKKDSFVAGADIGMLESVISAEQAAQLSRTGQRATSRLAHHRLPVVAAIHGSCLGGGLELALACRARVASRHPKTKLGLPEVQLGILPGMGGTFRLAPCVGLSRALDLLITGRQLDARRALQAGLIDEVVAPELVLRAAEEWALRLADEEGQQKGSWASLKRALDPEVLRDLALTDNPIGRRVVFDQARKRILAKTHGNYPAPLAILEAVRIGLERGEEAGLEREAASFGELVVSPEARALRHVYFSQQAAKKDELSDQDDTPREVRRVGVLGAGLMGVGLAQISLIEAGASVRIKDLEAGNLQRAYQLVNDELTQRVRQRRSSPWELRAALARLTTTTQREGLGSADLIIEAVFEDLPLKRSVLAEVEQTAGANLIFASNTSSIPIAQIAAESTMKERVVGMHYFSPVPKMPLLEVITTEQTAPWVTKTAVQFGKRQGKTVIVVADGPGFYTTRVLAPYLNEATRCILEGQRIEDVDAQLVKAGFPVGPLALLDEVGIDVGAKVARVLSDALGDRLAAPPQLAALLREGRRGRKNGRGFYDYGFAGSGARPADQTVYAALGVKVPTALKSPLPGLSEPGSAAERCLLALVNEAAHCLDAGILRSEGDGDLGAVFGLGFPPFLGGPFHFARQRGKQEVRARLERLQRSYGPRFRPAPFFQRD